MALHQILADSIWSRVYLERVYRDSVPRASGVYIICGRTEAIGNLGAAINSLNNAVYVGQSINLNTRFQDHVLGYGNVIKAKLTFRRLEYWWMEAPRMDLDRVEQALITALGPSANDKEVSVKARIGDPIRI